MTDVDHPRPETLAAHAAGDLDATGSAAVAAHVAACAACADDLAGLDATSAALAALAPARMPVDVITAIEQALTAERTAVAAPTDPTASTAPVASIAARRRRPSFAPFAAAAAVVGLAVAVGVGALQSGRGGRDDSATGADSAGAAISADAAPKVVQSGTDYTAAALADQVRSTLAAPDAFTLESAPKDSADAPAPAAGTGGGTSGGAGSAGRTANAPLADDDLESCLTELSGGPGATPVLVDNATYSGQPAVVVVLPFRDGKLDVFVVRPDCRAGNDALLFFARIDA